MLNHSFQQTNKFSFSSRMQWFIVIACIIMAFSACNKTDQYKSDQISEYMTLQAGRYWIYQLDSTNYINAAKIITHYKAKDVVDAQVTDNLGRPTWRIIRYLRPLTSTDDADWKILGDYAITPTEETLETIDFNNFKYQSLKLPVTQNLSWKGNSYLPDFPYSEASPFTAAYNFTVDNGMGDWDFTYSDIGETQTIGDQSYTNVVTVNQVDMSSNLLPDNETPVDVNAYSTRAYSVEQYAKGVGLVYKKFDLWEYQPPTTIGGNGYFVGFGIELKLLEHN